MKQHKDIWVIYKYLNDFDYKKLDSDVKKQMINDIFDICSDELDAVTFKECDCCDSFTTISFTFNDGDDDSDFFFNISNEHP